MVPTAFSALLALSMLISGATAAPLSIATRTDGSVSLWYPHSFDNWHGISSLHGFDNFYGVGNFDGSFFHQETVVQESEVVCHSVDVEIIQQKLVVLQEIAKRVITELICEVETQTIVFEQFSASFASFRSDLFRSTGTPVGYDSAIASHFGDLFEADGSLTTTDLGFIGSDIGKQLVVPSGSNWDDELSPSVLAGLEDDISSALTGVGSSVASGVTVPTPSVVIGSIPTDVAIIPATDGPVIGAPNATDAGVISAPISTDAGGISAPNATDAGVIPTANATDVGVIPFTSASADFGDITATAVDPSFTPVDPVSSFVPISDPALAPGTDSVTPIGDITVAPASASAAVSAAVTASV